MTESRAKRTSMQDSAI